MKAKEDFRDREGLISLLKRLWFHISERRKKQFRLLLVLMALTSFAEFISIGSVLPFLGALASPDRIYEIHTLKTTFTFLGINAADQLLVPLTIFFAVFALIAGGMRVLLAWATTKITFDAGADLSVQIYSRTLLQPYEVHLTRNSSEVITAISTKANDTIYHVLWPVLTLMGSSMLLLAILGVILFVAPVVTLMTFLGFSCAYAVTILFIKDRLYKNSQKISIESTAVIKSLQEGLGGIRDILLDGTQNTFSEIYRNADGSLRKAQGSNLFISQCPRFIVETLGILIIAMIAFFLAKEKGGFAQAIPILGILALSAQRMLPILQQAYLAWTGIRGGEAALQDTLRLLDQPQYESPNKNLTTHIPFESEILLSDLSFRYGINGPFIFNKINLRIKKGDRVGFIGKTGSGKSTLLDIVMGLLLPGDGYLMVDSIPISPVNRSSWQARIAHVPQAIFLTDATIEENIAFGVPSAEIDFTRVISAARQAQISELIDSWPKKYKTVVGERGIRISGGQRQRIGIARALYKKADVIVFDEATSALDAETEKSVMESLDNINSNITILIIAHRLSTLKGCTKIIELGHGQILRSASYAEIAAKPLLADID
jgi:ATP-binding cassette subfamily B protein